MFSYLPSVLFFNILLIISIVRWILPKPKQWQITLHKFWGQHRFDFPVFLSSMFGQLLHPYHVETKLLAMMEKISPIENFLRSLWFEVQYWYMAMRSEAKSRNGKSSPNHISLTRRTDPFVFIFGYVSLKTTCFPYMCSMCPNLVYKIEMDGKCLYLSLNRLCGSQWQWWWWWWWSG